MVTIANKPKRRLLFYVQHLLGVGHVFRARRLCEGFAAAGLSTEVIFGGVPVPDMRFVADRVHFLPPIKAGAIDYSFNVDKEGKRLTDDYMARRQQCLLEIFASLDPDLILIEAWPFGRRVVADEIRSMLEAAALRPKPPLVVTSVRDILQENRKAGRSEETVGAVQKYVDKVLVHSDPRLIQLKNTFPLATKIADKISYTGFVRAAEVALPKGTETFDVVATIGGGAFGAGMIEAALEARALSSLKNLRWCLCTGPNLPNESIKKLHQDRPAGVTIKTFLPNLAAHLQHAKLSISQVGYNTAMDVLSAGENGACQAVLVPSDIAGQSEQLRRAELLQQRGLAVNLPESRLTARTLANAIEEALALPKKSADIDFNGVEKSAELIADMVEAMGSPARQKES